MDCHDVSEVEYFKLLMEKAKDAHLKAQKEAGKKVAPYPSREEILAEFLPTLLHHRLWKQSNPHTVGTTQLPAAYPPCVKSSDKLKPMFISDMTMETHHRGRKILLRVCTGVYRINGLLMVTEDEQRNAIRLQLYHQPDEDLIPAEQLLKQGTVLLVKEPYFKRSLDGNYTLRVDHVSDVIWLASDDDRVPGKWRPRLLELDSVKARLRGNDFFKKHELPNALEQYTWAVKTAEDPVDAQLAYVNRSLINFRLGRPEMALKDAIAMSSKLQQTEKGAFREATCLYSLQRFEECLSKLQSLRDLYPNNDDVRVEIQKVTARLKECNDGIYDWQEMHRQAKSSPPLIDCGTFSKNVKVQASPGKGRGLFTTKPVVAGELLLCEKAFAYSFADTDDKTESSLAILLNFQTMTAKAGGQAQNLTQIVQKLYHAPEAAASFLDLHCGEYPAPQRGLTVDFMPVVDTFLVAETIAMNSFCAPRSTLELLNPALLHGESISNEKRAFGTSGIWNFIGDMMVIRATEDLPAGTELKFAYLDLDRIASYGEAQKKLAHWKFSCDCYLCKMQKKTVDADRRLRKAHLRTLRELLDRPVPINMNQARRLLKQIDKTFNKSGQKKLKLELQEGYLRLGQALFVRGNFVEATPMLLRALELGDFVLSGLSSSGPQDLAVIEIQKWGSESAVSCCAIRDLYRVCVKSAVTPLALDRFKNMRQYAIIAYSLVIGESETFASMMLDD
ncbi:Tetratricopeptide-like helical [Cordyceps fumosorosea ARSEF 2679]|uniref:Tetratricopeptide-like helical n=1 Tax=Cordyceps fumosorosea (strain ARSEF 2679) TaxID=1081104 RepID=A0A167XEH9_CORFA|nr:Tetratricopeptide-like helical [Cordyceps fumosorosea ARSEF 2679]OAA64877.1 Tetratricopeptide-like helical [Cordyceps fumosorosea ARSEF 2679]